MPVRFSDGRTVLNIAHRGGRSLAPENTIAAARKALELGADLWELDVAVTQDEKLIVLHDDSLARTTDVERRFPGRPPGPYTTYTLDEIRSLDAGSWFVETDPHGQIAAGALAPAELASYRGEKVPTLGEALAWTRDSNWRVNMELKRLPPEIAGFPLPARVMDLIEELGIAPEHLVISSIREDWLAEFRARRPDIAVEKLVGLLPSDPMDWSGYAYKTYNVRRTRVSEDTVRALTEKGHGVNVYVVNEEPDMLRFAAAGAAGLITDFPQVLKALAGRASP
ncbi:MAG: glycerophosphodiester phosphodiesterase family protein [Elusimicrobiota bacterium]